AARGEPSAGQSPRRRARLHDRQRLRAARPARGDGGDVRGDRERAGRRRAADRYLAADVRDEGEPDRRSAARTRAPPSVGASRLLSQLPPGGQPGAGRAQVVRPCRACRRLGLGRGGPGRGYRGLTFALTLGLASGPGRKGQARSGDTARWGNADEQEVRRRTLLSVAGFVAAIGVFVVVGLSSGHKALAAAVTPNWGLAALSLLVAASVQPFRALAWSTTLRTPIGFRAIYCSSSVGSLLDTLLPGRLGEASKAAVLRVAAADRWPGFPRAAGSLLCSHMLEACAFTVVG